MRSVRSAGGRLQQTDAAFVSFYNNERLAYNFSNTLPTTLTMYANHGANNPFEMNTTALYAQDQWTGGRLTLQGGIRFEQIGSYYPESIFVADRFLPNALTFAAQDAGVGPKDIDPRFGAAYDLFGNGKTSLKFSMGRYPTADNSYGTYGWLQQPANRVATSTNRNWNDLTFAAGDPRRAHVGYYLIDEGLRHFEAATGYRHTVTETASRFVKDHATPVYLGFLALYDLLFAILSWASFEYVVTE
jgi:hypothetical protein